MQLIRLVHQLISFLLEMSMLLALGMWGFHGEKSMVEKWFFGLGIPLMAAVLWGIWAAPKSEHRLDLPYRLLFSLTLFGLAAFLLYRIGHQTLAIVFAILALISVLVEWITEQ